MEAMKSKRSTRGVVVLLALTMTMARVAIAGAEEVSGTSWARVESLEDGTGLNLDRGATFLVNWKVWTLMGEPVVDSTAAWNEWKGTSVVRLPKWIKRYTGSPEVPVEVLEKIRVYNVELYGEVWSREGLMLDPGVFAKPLLHSTGSGGTETPEWRTFKEKNAGQQKEYFSFNVPGRPEWSELFKTGDGGSGGVGVLGVRIEDAKALVKKGFRIGDYDGKLKVRKVSFDLSAVHEWLWGLEQKAIEEWKAEVRKEESVLAAKEEERKKAEEADFWGTPANTDTGEDRTKREWVEGEKHGIEKAEKELEAARQTIAAERKKVDLAIGKKRDALAKTPKPEERAAADEVFVEGGTFQMGSVSGGSDEQAHQVTVSPFYMGKYEVKVGNFRKFVEATGYRTEAERGDGSYVLTGSRWEKQKDATWKNPYFEQGETSPIVCVSWNDAVAYCNWLSEKKGLEKVYTIYGGSVNADFTRKGYRLPTEAEWEYAARGGKLSKGYTYAGSNDSGPVAWYNGNSGRTTHAVGTKAPNELGLYDMSGNVYEWCHDWYGRYGSGAQTDPMGASSGSHRVIRGGSWLDAEYCRSAFRSYYYPVDGIYLLGFRLARRP